MPGCSRQHRRKRLQKSCHVVGQGTSLDGKMIAWQWCAFFEILNPQSFDDTDHTDHPLFIMLPTRWRNKMIVTLVIFHVLVSGQSTLKASKIGKSGENWCSHVAKVEGKHSEAKWSKEILGIRNVKYILNPKCPCPGAKNFKGSPQAPPPVPAQKPEG